MKKTLRLLLVLALFASAGFGVMGLVATPAVAKGPCICPQIYAPVQCDHNKTYPNQCVADCRNAKNCVPVGAI